MAANFVSLLIFPESNPLARGSLTMMATSFSWRGEKETIGFWRKMLKMI